MGEKSQKNLAAAFAGESQAFQKYMAFAEAADKEGFSSIAQLFRSTAQAEMIHARKHLRNMGGIKDTAENLKAAIAGETFECTKMYPEFMAEAKAENDKAAQNSFMGVGNVEKEHAEVYTKALSTLAEKKIVKYYLCPICGYIAAGEKPEKCPICGAKGNMFKFVE